ncbi:MAG: ComF family protein [Bacillota bacterium]|nr:ComF family protein [Bacillota bacterium]
MAQPRFWEILLFPRDLTCPYCDDENGFCDCASQIGRYRKDLCLLCGKELPLYEEYAPYGYRCKECQEQFHYFRAHRSVFYYEGAVRNAIRRFKYKDRIDLADPFGREIAALYQRLKQEDPAFAEVDWITPVPIRWTRRFVRGYNQAEELASVISKQIALPCRDVLSRARGTRRLSGLKKEDRKKELDNAIIVKSKWKSVISGAKVLLIDDIYTTGSTLDAAAKALYHCGAREIVALSIARGKDGTLEL